MEICRDNVNPLLRSQISQLIDLSLAARTLYSNHYIKGRGFVVGKDLVGPEGFREMLTDPEGLIDILFNPHRAAYIFLEDGFLITCSVVCQSRQGGGTLFHLVTGRNREGVARHSRLLRWPPAFRL